MKSFILTSIKSLILAGILVLVVGFVSADSVWAPQPQNGPTNGNPPRFLDVSASNQYKVGGLFLGRTSIPTPAGAPLPKLWGEGQVGATNLVATGLGYVSGRMSVGTGMPPAGPSELEIDTGMTVTSLAHNSSSLREVCSNAQGVLELCQPIEPPPPPPPVCTANTYTIEIQTCYETGCGEPVTVYGPCDWKVMRAERIDGASPMDDERCVFERGENYGFNPADYPTTMTGGYLYTDIGPAGQNCINTYTIDSDPTTPTTVTYTAGNL